MSLKKLTYQVIFIVSIIGANLFAPSARAIECLDQNQCSKQIKKLTKFARYGSPHAQILLAALYYEGELVNQDYKKSFRLYQKAAKQKPVIGIANYKLALAYLDGKGTKKNSDKAIKYLTKAAKVGHANAQSLLGLLYFEGIETKRNYTKAQYFFDLSAQSNDPRAQFMLGQIAEFGLVENKNLEKALSYYTLSATNKYQKSIQKLQQLSSTSRSNLLNEDVIHFPKKEPVSITEQSFEKSKGEIMVIYGNNLPVIEMMDIALANIREMKVYNSQWTGSHIPGHGCGDGMNQCTIITDQNLIWNMMNGNN